MNNIYILTAYDVLNQYNFETRIFTNRKLALTSMDNLANYCKANYHCEGIYTDDAREDRVQSWIDSRVLIKLHTHYIQKTEAKYN